MNRLRRLWKHAGTSDRSLRKTFPQKTLDAITLAVSEAERHHSGEIRFIIEASLSAGAIQARQTPRERAIDVFAQQRVWDTQHNDGVLIYVLLADRAVEIVADRGVAHGAVLPAEWQKVCTMMQTHFREGRFEEGAVAGVRATADVLARHPAGERDAGNELPNEPLLLR